MTYSDSEPFLSKLQKGVVELQLQGDLLLAVSGGADSMALLRGMLELQGESPHRLAVAHFNHRLRGEESDRDEQWLVQACADLGLECIVGTAEGARTGQDSTAGVEEAARNARYHFLQKTALARGFDTIAVAHTKDDQVETVLHHLMRGTGIAGLRGMPSRRELSPKTEHHPALSLVRPMLAITRRQTVDFLATRSQVYREDPSNADTRFTRNRIRHELLPLLEQSFNPQVREALHKLAVQATELQGTLGQLVGRLLSAALVDVGEDHARLDCSGLREQPRHLIRECFVELWKQQNWPRKRMTYEHFDRLADIVLTGGAATLPGNIAAERRGELVVLRRGL